MHNWTHWHKLTQSWQLHPSSVFAFLNASCSMGSYNLPFFFRQSSWYTLQHTRQGWTSAPVYRWQIEHNSSLGTWVFYKRVQITYQYKVNMILAVRILLKEQQKQTWKFRSDLDLNAAVCDTGAVLCQLNYQANSTGNGEVSFQILFRSSFATGYKWHSDCADHVNLVLKSAIQNITFMYIVHWFVSTLCTCLY